MGQGSGSTRAISTTGLPEWQDPYAKQVLSEGQRLYNTQTPGFFPGSTVAGLTPAEIGGSQYLQKTAGDIANMYGPGSEAANTLSFQMRAADVANNPYATAAAKAAINPIFDRLERQTLPNARMDAVQVGGLGGSRDQLYRAQLASDAARNAMDVTSGMYKDMYGQGLAAQQQALNTLPAFSEGMVAPGMILSGVGAQERAHQQAQIDEQIARHNFEQSVPYTKLMEYANLVNHPYGGTGASAVEAVPAEGQGTLNTIGGILGGVGAGLSIWDLIRRAMSGGGQTPTPRGSLVP